MALFDPIRDVDIQKFTIEESVVADGQSVGCFCRNTVEIEAINPEGRYNDLISRYGTDAYWASWFGYFKIDELIAEQGSATIKLRCSDLASKFDKEYKDSELENYHGINLFNVSNISQHTCVDDWEVGTEILYYDNATAPRDITVDRETGEVCINDYVQDLDENEYWEYVSNPYPVEMGNYTFSYKGYGTAVQARKNFIAVIVLDSDNKILSVTDCRCLNRLQKKEIDIPQRDCTVVFELYTTNGAQNPTPHYLNLDFRRGGSSASFTPQLEGLTWPTTVGNWLNYICLFCDVPLATPTFPNSDLELSRRPWLPEGASYRDAIKEIAGAGGCFAKLDNPEYGGYFTSLYIDWYHIDGYTPTNIADWFELDLGTPSEYVNTVVLGRGELEDNIYYPTDFDGVRHELRIDDNQILYLHETEAIANIYNKVAGFQYTPFKMRTAGYNSLNAGNTIKFKDLDGNDVTTVVMSHKRTFLGGDYENDANYEDEFEAVELNETNTNFSYAGTIEKRVKTTEAHVDKIEGNIELITEDIADVRDEFNNYSSIVYTNYLVQNAIDGLTNTFSKAGGNNLIRNSSLFYGKENEYDYWDGNLKQADYQDATTRKALLLQSGTVMQHVTSLAVGDLSLRFKYAKIGQGVGSTIALVLNGKTTQLTEESGTVEMTWNSQTGLCDVGFTASDSGEFVVYDIMLNYGSGIYLPYSQSMNELKSTQVKISEKIEIESTSSNTRTELGANGLEGYNKTTNTLSFKLTDQGSYSKVMECYEAHIDGLLIKRYGDEIWISEA